MNLNKRNIMVILSCVLMLLALILSYIFITGKNQNTNSIEDLDFTYNPFSEREIIRAAQNANIKEEDIPYFCPYPKYTGINECLMYTYQKNYGKSFYQGEKAKLFNKLLIDYSNGTLKEKDVIEEVNNETAWIENYKGISKDEYSKQQVLVTDVNLHSFVTSSNLANQIWAEIATNHYFYDSDYLEVLIYYDADQQKNTVNLLSVNLVYIEES